MNMSMTIPQGYCGVPFYENELINTDRFISFANKCGIKTDYRELEFFHKHNLLIPALRTFYLDGTNAKKVRHEIPAMRPFEKWSNLKSTARNKIASNTNHLKKIADHFYTKKQIIVLDELKKRLCFLISPEGCLRTNDEWVKIGSDLREKQKKLMSFLSQQSKQKNQSFALYLEVIDLNNQFAKLIRQWANKQRKDFNESLSQADIKSYRDLHEIPFFKENLPEALNRHDLSMADLRDWIVYLDGRSFFSDPLPNAYNWLQKFFPHYLTETSKGDFYLACFYRSMAIQLARAYENAGGEWDDNHLIYTKSESTQARSCKICGDMFFPNPLRRGGRRQVTCSKECSLENNRMRIYSKRADNRRGVF